MTEKLKVATLLLAESEKENEKLNEQVEQLKSRIEYLEEKLKDSIENDLVNEFMETNFFWKILERLLLSPFQDYPTEI